MGVWPCLQNRVRGLFSLVVALTPIILFSPHVVTGQPSVDGIGIAEVMKSIEEQLDYVAAQPLGEPPLLLTGIDVELTTVAERTAQGGLTFKVVLFEAGGKVEVISATTTKTHVKLSPSKAQLFAAPPPPIPVDKFLIEQ